METAAEHRRGRLHVLPTGMHCPFPRNPTPLGWIPEEGHPMHLQDEDEVVDRPVTLVQAVLCSSPVLLVKLQLLDDVGVLQKPQQDLL